MLTIATTPGVYSALKSKRVFFLRKGVLSHTYTYRVLSALRIRVTWGAETMLTVVPLQVLSSVGQKFSSQWDWRAEDSCE